MAFFNCSRTLLRSGMLKPILKVDNSVSSTSSGILKTVRWFASGGCHPNVSLCSRVNSKGCLVPTLPFNHGTSSRTLAMFGGEPTRVFYGTFRNFSLPETSFTAGSPGFLLRPQQPLDIKRTVTKFSLRKGRRKTVKAVIKRFYRLDWGAWISPKPGRTRHLWKKSAQRRRRLRFHIFRKAWETKTLDRMVTKYWIKKKYFVNDPYESYHTRDNFKVTKGVKGIQSTWLRHMPTYGIVRNRNYLKKK